MQDQSRNEIPRTGDELERKIEVVSTGSWGLDSVLGGGLPRRRVMLVVGSSGSGKTVLSMQFLVHGAAEAEEPGILVSFEETREELSANAAGFGWGLDALIDDGSMAIIPINLDATEASDTGEFDLSGLFFRIENAVQRVGAKRIVIDGVNNLAAAFRRETVVRGELMRLFRWLKGQGLTVVVTGERGIGQYTRLGFEEYLADGLLMLDNRTDGRAAKRVVRVVKCRGVAHSTDEYPFLMNDRGFVLYPVTTAELEYPANSERISLGVKGLDEMFGGDGVHRGSTILVSGTSGAGKTSIGAGAANAACQRGEKALIVQFEEASAQIIRNSAGVGIDLQRWVDAGQLSFHTSRPAQRGLEAHLTVIQDLCDRMSPSVVVIDPVTSFLGLGEDYEVRSMLVRLIHFFRRNGITVLLNYLVHNDGKGEDGNSFAISSMADTWIHMQAMENRTERNNIIKIIKSRGTKHSNQVHEFTFTPEGITIEDAYVGADGVALGSERILAKARDDATRKVERANLVRQQKELEGQRLALANQIASLEADFKAREDAFAEVRQAFDDRMASLTEASELIAEQRGSRSIYDASRARGHRAFEAD